MTGNFCQDLYDIIYPTLPKEWDKLVVYAVFLNETYGIKYYVRENTKTFIDCFELDIDGQVLLNIIGSIYYLLSDIRRKNYEHKKWYGITAVINSTGDFTVDYEYFEKNINSDEYYEKWRNIYLY